MKILQETVEIINGYIGGTYYIAEDIAAWYAQEFSVLKIKSLFQSILKELALAGAYFDHKTSLLVALEYEKRGIQLIAERINDLPISNENKFRLAKSHPRKKVIRKKYITFKDGSMFANYLFDVVDKP